MWLNKNVLAKTNTFSKQKNIDFMQHTFQHLTIQVVKGLSNVFITGFCICWIYSCSHVLIKLQHLCICAMSNNRLQNVIVKCKLIMSICITEMWIAHGILDFSCFIINKE